MLFLKYKYNFWFALSIITAILFSLIGLQLAFQSSYAIQDDARQHIFWMQRFVDPDLFSQDLIADYFQSVAPNGFIYLYKILNLIGIEPILTSKILPLILGAIATIFCFRVCLEIFPIPLAGFLAALLLNQNLWLVDDLSSATPRAFFYPLFLGFIYYLLKEKLIPCLIFIILEGLFYPHLVLISIFLILIRFFHLGSKTRFSLPLNKPLLLYLIYLATAIIILLIYSLQLGEFGEVISLKDAKNLPEFGTQGRTAFFIANPVSFWLCAQRSGFFPREWQYVLLCSFGILLPLLRLSPSKFPLVRQIKPEIIILIQILVASLILFLLAHLFLFKLHLPSRYSQHSFRIILAITDSILITLVLERFVNWLNRKTNLLSGSKNFLGQILIIIVLVFCLVYPSYAASKYPYRLGYVTGESVNLYQFLQQQPKNYLVASLSQEANLIPSFAKRSVLVAEEYAIPYHVKYYQQIRQRVKDLIKAQYSQNLEEIKIFMAKYDINLWLIDKNAFNPEYLQNNLWLRQFQSEVTQAIENLKQNKKLALAESINQCNIFREQNSIVLSAKCLIEQN
jgi:hypothetical protein